MACGDYEKTRGKKDAHDESGEEEREKRFASTMAKETDPI